MNEKDHRDGLASAAVVILGDFSHEGLAAKISSLGFQLHTKNLRSRPKHWLKIRDFLDDLNEQGALAQLFVYMPTSVLLDVSHSEFNEVRPELLECFVRSSAVIFIYEDNFEGRTEPPPWELRSETELAVQEAALGNSDRLTAAEKAKYLEVFKHHHPTLDQWIQSNQDAIARAQALLHQMVHLKIELVPFRKRSDVTLRMFELLENAEAGIFLKLYVPHGRYQSEQFEEFLSLFSRYLREIEGKDFTVDSLHSRRGTTYVFKGRGEVGGMEDLRDATKRFDAFLVLAESNPAGAERLLAPRGVADADAAFVVAKYARAYQRLHLDMRHEFERRQLAISQSMDAELLEAGGGPRLLPPLREAPSSSFSVFGNSAPVTINVSASSVSGENVRLEQVLSGGIDYSDEDRELVRLIDGLGDRLEALQLRSDLDRLKDHATTPAERITAVQKLKGLVYRTAGYLGKEVGTPVLVSYLEKLLNLGQ